MARGVKVIREDILSDDLDGTSVESPEELFRIFLGFNGNVYQLDVCRKNMNAFENSVKRYVAAAKKADEASDTPGVNVKLDSFFNDKGFTSLIGIRAAGGAVSRSEHAEWLTKVRVWAQQNNRKVSDRGRISDDVKNAYVVATDDKEPAN